MGYVNAVRGPTLILTLLSASLFPLALPNELFQVGNPFIGIISLVPLYLAVRSAPTPRAATRIGAVFGGVSTLFANYWLMFFGDYSIWTITGTTIGYMGYNAILAAFLWKSLHAPSGYRPILFALTWMGYEFLKSTGFLAYPWGLAAYPLGSVSTLIQIADVTGIWGITLLLVLVNGVVSEFLLMRFGEGLRAASQMRRNSPFPQPLAPEPHVRETSRTTCGNALFAAVLVVVTLSYGVWVKNRQIAPTGEIDVILVQQNADSWDVSDLQTPLRTAQDQTRRGLAAAADAPDLVVWSETSLRFPYDQGRAWYTRNPIDDPFAEFLANLPAPLLTGSPVRSPENAAEYHNGVILVDPRGDVVSWYGKQHLVPFAENVPFWNFPAVQSFFKEVVGLPAIWAPGPGYRLFAVRGKDGGTFNIGTPVCFEDSFPDVCRGFVLAGADVLINLTNNAWSRTNSAQLQHFVAARFRSVESRRTLIRSTNAGFTAVIDPWGRVTDSLPMFEPGFLRVSAPIYTGGQTLYVRYGDYLPIAALVLLFGLLVCSAVYTWRGTAWRGTTS